MKARSKPLKCSKVFYAHGEPLPHVTLQLAKPAQFASRLDNFMDSIAPNQELIHTNLSQYVYVPMAD